MAQKPVTKAVIAAAGYGTRFLPQTKAMPKEMLPIFDKPVIQYIVEDLVAAGITDIIIVDNPSKRPVREHFGEPSADLISNLESGGESKQHFIDEIKAIAHMANFIFLQQNGPYGTAAPILTAAHLLNNEPFIYCFADDILKASPNFYQQMISRYNEFGGSIVACMRLTQEEDYDRYGYFAGDAIREDVLRVTRTVERPGMAAAPSDFASVGGFLFAPEILQYLEAGLRRIPAGKEFYANEHVMQPMIDDGYPFYACEIQDSRRYDTGDKLEYVKTVIDFALDRPDIGQDVKAYIKSLSLD